MDNVYNSAEIDSSLPASWAGSLHKGHGNRQECNLSEVYHVWCFNYVDDVVYESTC